LQPCKALLSALLLLLADIIFVDVWLAIYRLVHGHIVHIRLEPFGIIFFCIEHILVPDNVNPYGYGQLAHSRKNKYGLLTFYLIPNGTTDILFLQKN
jgi:hypothetical protein